MKYITFKLLINGCTAIILISIWRDIICIILGFMQQRHICGLYIPLLKLCIIPDLHRNQSCMMKFHWSMYHWIRKIPAFSHHCNQWHVLHNHALYFFYSLSGKTSYHLVKSRCPNSVCLNDPYPISERSDSSKIICRGFEILRDLVSTQLVWLYYANSNLVEVLLHHGYVLISTIC